MTHILSYNILVGGMGRVDDIESMIRMANPDVVGLVEATNSEVVETLAKRLGMEYRTNAAPHGGWRTSSALLSRLPIVNHEVHPSLGILARPLLEVTLEEAHGEKLTAFVTHLNASFSQGRAGDHLRIKEVRELLRIMRTKHGPHLLMGDFNALAPGDALKASHLLRYLMDQDKRRKQSPQDSYGHPYLDTVVPQSLRVFNPILRMIPRSQFLCDLFDGAGSLYAPRGSIGLLRDAGYVDCFRYINPRAWGFTCPSASPAGRIDYIFANPLLATRLATCKVVSGDARVNAEEASDHLPLLAEFGVKVETTFRPLMEHSLAAEEALGEAR